MGTRRPSTVLEEEHQAIDQGVEAYLAGPAPASVKALVQSIDLLRRHIYLEEVVLFPALAEAHLEMPLFVMRREHGQMWPVMAALSAGLAAEEAAADLVEQARDLLLRLQAHNPKEESMIYAAADDVVAPAARDALLARWDTAAFPADWVCEALRS